MSNIVDYILNNAQHADHVAIIGPDQSIAYGELKAKVLQSCTYFQQKLTSANNRVTIAAGDSVAFAVAALGVMAAGGILTSLPNKGDHSTRLAKIDPAMIFDDGSILEWYNAIQHLPQSQPIDTSGPCLFLASGGTTGAGKFFIHTHETVYNTAMVAPGTIIGTSEDISLSVVPLYAAWGIMGLIANLMNGTTVVIGCGVAPTQIKRTIEKNHVTYMSATPAIYGMMLKHDIIPNPLPRTCDIGGDFTTEHLRQEWYKKTGSHLTHLMGTSEAGVLFVVPKDNVSACPMNSLGKGITTTEIELRDDDGNVVPTGQPGSLWVRNKTSCVGLWQDPDKEKLICQNDWISIDDMITQDHDGNYFFVGRKSELFKVDAKLVDVTGVENSCLSSGLLDDVLAIPLYDKQNRTHIKLLAVANKATVLESLDTKLKEYLLSVLPQHEVPGYIQVVDELPRTPAGKKVRKPEFL
jgi:acyl-coenzyme A synthetase/AMP-(fatty) acid ligase